MSEDQLAALWFELYPRLVRLAALLLDEVDLAEDVVQEAYIKAVASRRHLRDPEAAEAYLKRTVVNIARSIGRHRAVVRRHAERVRDRERQEVVASAESEAMANAQHSDVKQALASLGARQREAIVLRYWGGLTEAETADVMKCSVGSVKSYCSRGIATMGVRMGATR